MLEQSSEVPLCAHGVDSWFAALNNFVAIRVKGKNFIEALKENRVVALSQANRSAGRFARIEKLNLPKKQAMRGWLKDYDYEVLLIREVITNKDGSIGVRHLVCSDLTSEGNAIIAFFQKRWKWKSFKSHTAASRKCIYVMEN